MTKMTKYGEWCYAARRGGYSLHTSILSTSIQQGCNIHLTCHARFFVAKKRGNAPLIPCVRVCCKQSAHHTALVVDEHVTYSNTKETKHKAIDECVIYLNTTCNSKTLLMNGDQHTRVASRSAHRSCRSTVAEVCTMGNARAARTTSPRRRNSRSTHEHGSSR